MEHVVRILLEEIISLEIKFKCLRSCFWVLSETKLIVLNLVEVVDKSEVGPAMVEHRVSIERSV